MALRHGTSRYEITVVNPVGVSRGIAFASLDDVAIAERPLRLLLADDGTIHRILVRLG
jgi:cyclic beta-1,2-glucan synthetase